MPRDERLIDGVFQGAGAAGLAHLGALEVLESRGYWFRRVTGSSAGSVIAALIACGYRALPGSPCSLRTLLALDHREFLDGGWLSSPRRLLRDGGLFEGRRLQETVDGLLKRGLGAPPEAPSPTFANLKEIDLYLVASNLTSREILVLGRQTTPDLSIAEAVRMSASLPFVFIPRRWQPSAFYADVLGTVELQTVVDGGVLSSFPMFVFKDPPPYLSEQPQEGRTRPKLGFVLMPGEKPGLGPVERYQRRRRARPVSRWWTRTAMWLGIAAVLCTYAFTAYHWGLVTTFHPLWDPLDGFAPLSVWLSWIPEVIQRVLYTMITFYISLPKLVAVLLPAILAVVALSRPGRLLWRLTGLATVGFDRRYVRSDDSGEIFVGPYSAWRLRLSDDQRQDLVERGYEAAHRFLPEWEARHHLPPSTPRRGTAGERTPPA